MRLPDPVRAWMTRLLAQDAAARGETPPVSVQAPQETALPKPLSGWLQTAAAQMRWKRAQPCAARELRSHLSEQYEAFLAEGMDEAAAADATVREMGDPVETGTRLDRAWRPAPDWVTLGLVLLLAAAGKLLQYRLRQPLAAAGGPQNNILTMVLTYAIGAAVLLAAYFIDYTVLGRHIRLLYALWCAGGLLTFMGPFHVIVSGAANFYLRQWVWFFPLLFAGVLYAQRGKGTAGVWNCLAALLPLWAFCIIAPSTGAMVTITLLCCILLTGAVKRGVFGGKRGRQLALSLSPLAAIVAGVRMVQAPHVQTRLAVLFNPTLDPTGAGFQGAAAWEALFGGVFPAEYRQNVLRLFERDGACDFMLTAAKLRWGWLAFALIVGALAVLLVRGLRIARRQNGLLARTVCDTVIWTLALQTAAYVLQNLGFIAFMAYGLPLFSYGGTYLWQTMLLLGALLSACRTGRLETGSAPIPAPPLQAQTPRA